MPLDPNLRSGTTGIESNSEGAAWNAEQPTKTDTFARTSASEKTLPNKDTNTNSDDCSPRSDQMPLNNNTTALLNSIEINLKTLIKSVADLGKRVEAMKNPDCNAIIKEINSARLNIEQTISGLGIQNNEPCDKAIIDKINELEAAIKGIAEKQDRNDRQLTQTLRENANFQIQVRQGMQHELEAFKEQENGEQFNPILKEISAIYADYQDLLKDDSISDKSQKNLKALFEQIGDLLQEYDSEIQQSEIGTNRQTRSTKIIEKILTGDKEKHNTVAASRKPGVVRGRTVLRHEFIDVYVYAPSIAVAENGFNDEPENAIISEDDGNETLTT